MTKEKTKQSAHEKAKSNSLKYHSGFGNQFASEAEIGALPVGQNSPQNAPLGLYAEQLNGSSFASPRHENLRSWLYRIRPSVLHLPFVEINHPFLQSRPFSPLATPNQMRWDALANWPKSADFVDGLFTMAGNGDASSVRGCAIHIYLANRSMESRFFFNADGELLIVPQEGEIELRTEFGTMTAIPGEIAIIPCGIKFQVLLTEGRARGYICENYGPPFRLPQLGPIGANGLANQRDFLSPVACYEDKPGDYELVSKFQGKLWTAKMKYSPLDVVAWHGNYAPYKYDLSCFQVINSVSFDHCDPSIFTVLTSPSELPGVANVDFVIFPPRWSVAEHTFRPAFFHRNCMSEFMGLIFGAYEAKQEGFVRGGASLHNKMSAHGPDAQAVKKAQEVTLTPQKLEDTLAFMFESSLVLQPTEFALTSEYRQRDYHDCWQDFQSQFHATTKNDQDGLKA
jgi:homogentisate 1,2-dioxygenase